MQLYPDKRVLICGHADRSGETAYNFELSALRAEGVYHLLTGNRPAWAKLAASKHRVEDYQQIMKYYAVTNRWRCDPGAIDNTWGRKTEAATKEFIAAWNTLFRNKASDAKPLDPSLVEQIKNSSSRAWPAELWEAVYDLYEYDLMTAACGHRKQFDGMRKYLAMSFVDADRL